MKIRQKKELRLINRIPCMNNTGSIIEVLEYRMFIENIPGLFEYRVDGKPVNRLDENTFEQVTLIGLPKLTRINLVS